MISFKLYGNKAYQWFRKDNHFFTGYLFNDNNDILTGENAIDFLLNYPKKRSKTVQFHGIYTFIKNMENGIAIITDTINYFPLFYFKQNKNWILSDNWNYLTDIKGGIKPNLDAEIEFLSVGFVLGNETLDVDILKTRVGEKLLLNNDGTFERIPDYYYLPEFFIKDNFQKINDILIDKIDEAGHRLIKFLDSRTAVLPLSGGFDSRLIASVLKKLNYESVICFTYGRKTDEVDVSSSVAQILGYKWYFIDYSEIDLTTYIQDSGFLEYINFIGNGYTMPYLQEYFAVKKLVENKLIPDNSVFLSGHVGDNIAGSYILKSIKTTQQNNRLFNNLIENYFFFKKITKNEKQQLKKRISITISDYPKENNYSKNYNPYIEDWSLKEKFSKFLFHSSKVFDFWGYNTYFLLWDKEIVDFFRNLPYKHRENKLLYNYTLINEFFISLNIYFPNKETNTHPLQIKVQKVKNRIRNFFPWKYIYKIMEKHDWMYYSPLTSIMEKEMEVKGYKKLRKFSSFNAIICRWYLDFVNFYKKNINP